jgi:hypothetical protein
MKASAELAAIMARKRAPDPEIVAGYLSGEIVTTPARSLNRSQRRYGGRFTRRRYQRSPDREKSIERRRTLAATWPMPPKMCGKLTTSQAAWAKIVADEVARTGDCRLDHDQIAARAGICRKTAQRAQARFLELGWITREVREVEGRKNLPNIVRIVSPEWLTWIKMGPTVRSARKTGGHFASAHGQRCPATVNQFFPKSESATVERPQGVIRWEHGARTGPPDTGRAMERGQ